VEYESNFLSIHNITFMNKIMEELMDKHLNLDKIKDLPDIDKKIILDLYNSMHDAINGKGGTPGGMSLPGGISMDNLKAQVIYNTLTEYGYLVTRRDSNLDKILR
jgi:hypothetical protein